MFTRDDARWLADTVGALYSVQDSKRLASVGIEAVYRRFNLVASCFEEISYDHSHYLLHGARGENSLPADHAAFIHDHPALNLVQPDARLETFQVRDLVSFRTWQATDNFNGIARRMGYSDQISVLTYGATVFIAFVVFRDRVFQPNEHALLALLQPHLQATLFRVRSDTDTSLADAPAPLTLSAQLRPLEIGSRQRVLLRRYFPHWREPNLLPEELRAWVATSLRRLSEPLPLRPLQAFVTQSAYGRLLCRCFPNPSNGSVVLHLVETPHHPGFLDLRRRGLTTRECEVLHWIAEGKRDAEIAGIIACSSATVGKHVENLLRKLHAENRAAAVGAASDWLGAPGRARKTVEAKGGWCKMA